MQLRQSRVCEFPLPPLHLGPPSPHHCPRRRRRRSHNSNNLDMATKVEPTKSKRPRPKPPTYLQSLLATAVLISLSLLFIPITLPLTISALIWTRLNGTSLALSKPVAEKKTVLVTGARSNKALHLIRAFKRAGHRVIAAEEREWGTWTSARFSRAVDRYYALPNAPHDFEEGETNAYIDAIKRIVVKERVDAWIPCSSVHATMQDAEAARQIKDEELGGPDKATVCDTFIQHPRLAGSLHWKDQFTDLLSELGYPILENKRVTDVSQAVEFLYSRNRQSGAYILKCLTLDDLARDDFTLLPLASRDETVAHLKNMPTPMDKHTPFLLQRFVDGPEYCCHVAARNGEVTAFVVCRSSEMLMRYVDVSTLGAEEVKMGRMIERWVRGFLTRWKGKLEKERGGSSFEKELTGHFSFDFMWDVKLERLYALECNVRAHTAVCLFSIDNPILSQSYLDVASPPLSRPPSDVTPVSWITHAFPLATIRSFLRLPLIRTIPPHLLAKLHPSLPPLAGDTAKKNNPIASPQWSDTPSTVLTKFLAGTFKLPESHSVKRRTEQGEKDGYWEWTDPVPFFVLMHATWVWLWLRLAVGRRGKWRRVNVSTERMFEC
ncbi:hypothetical protein BXZ70DRAFT_749051 [Cristinia sonorae]|uniref:ATP-grasp domain-containing protein n=1 Tax=Cristinia sonorae TaxID=1940300 RepID=A0A8K0UDV5_9AGAR|nr:hypothetical protein BXZ70DRAFT_749051 [Cristinia sonorae]